MPIRFDGNTANYFSRTTNLPAVDGFTFACWYKITTDLNVVSQIPVVLYSDVNNFVKIRTSSNGTTQSVAWRSLSTSIASSSFTLQAMSVGVWYFLSFTLSGVNFNGYSGAVTARTLTATSGTATGGSTWFTPTNLRFGRDELASPSPSDGVIANIKMWQAVLTQDELEKERWLMLPKRTTNLHARYLLQPGASEVDHHNGFNMTVNGTLANEDGPPMIWGGKSRRFFSVVTAIQYNQSVSGSVTPTGALTKQTSKSFAGAFTPTGAITRMTGKALGGTLTPTGAISRDISKLLVGSTTPTSTTNKQTTKTYSGTVAPTGDPIKQWQHQMGGAFDPSGGAIKQAQKVFTGSMTPTGALTAIRTVLVSLVGAITPSGAMTKQVGKSLSGVITPTATLLKQIAKFFTGIFAPSGAVSAFTPGSTPLERTYSVPADGRIYTPADNAREFDVPLEDRSDSAPER